MHQPNKTTIIAAVSLLFAATLWGVFWYPLRWLESEGIGGLWATLLIYLGTSVYFIPYLKRSFIEIRTSPVLMLALAFFAGVTNIAFFLAVIDGEVVRVLLLFYMSPIWATVLAYFILNERLSLHNLSALVIALFGMVIMLWRVDMKYPWPTQISDWLALLSGVAFAITNVVMRMTHTISSRSKAIVGWYGVIIVSLVLIAILQLPFPEFKISTFTIAFIIGATMVVVMTLAVAYGVSQLPVQQSAVILLFEVIVGAVSAYVLIGEVMAVHEWIGGVLILFAGVFITFNGGGKLND